MIFLLSIFTLLYAVAEANPHPLSEDFIDLINSKQTSWKAGMTFPKDTTLEHIKRRLGPNLDKKRFSQLPVRRHTISPDDLPENFDAREKWPNCPSLREIPDQGCCDSGWAFSAVTAMTDRVCIYSNGTQQFRFSAQDLISCDDSNGGCIGGGDPETAWSYWVDKGLVSGGGYKSNEGCRPYEVSGDNEGPIPNPCLKIWLKPTPKCEQKCRKEYEVDYKKDKHYGIRAYVLQNEADYKAELFLHGPIEVSFTLYWDLVNYKSGIYHHHSNEWAMGQHAVRLLGWGVENGTKYWLCANSWNTSWGDKGYFKILRGTNEGRFEEGAVAGEPKL